MLTKVMTYKEYTEWARNARSEGRPTVTKNWHAFCHYKDFLSRDHGQTIVVHKDFYAQERDESCIDV